MKENITIGFVTAEDPEDKKSWSGIYYRMKASLENEFHNVVPLGPVKLSVFQSFKMTLTLKITSLLHLLIYFKRYNELHNHLRSKYHGRFFEKRLAQEQIDVIFAPTASVEIAHLETDIPICYFSDTSFAQINEYYELFSRLSSRSVRISNEIEQLAIDNSTTQVYPSDWAANFVKSYYDAKQVFIAKMGANIDAEPDEKELVKQFDSTIHILFVGVDWQRKGGDLVFDTIMQLDQKGVDFHLTVCGCKPPKKHPKMTVIPFLDKNKSEDNLTFLKLLHNSHLFFMPTRAECYGIVFCEANAYGLPVITTDTGGTTSVVEDGINGFALPFSAKAEDYAARIEYLTEHRDVLEKMSKTARQKYAEELNWNHWGKRMKEILS